jgi:hypothetical protein
LHRDPGSIPALRSDPTIIRNQAEKDAGAHPDAAQEDEEKGERGQIANAQSHRIAREIAVALTEEKIERQSDAVGNSGGEPVPVGEKEKEKLTHAIA